MTTQFYYVITRNFANKRGTACVEASALDAYLAPFANKSYCTTVEVSEYFFVDTEREYNPRSVEMEKVFTARGFEEVAIAGSQCIYNNFKEVNYFTILGKKFRKNP